MRRRMENAQRGKGVEAMVEGVRHIIDLGRGENLGAGVEVLVEGGGLSNRLAKAVTSPPVLVLRLAA